MLMTFLAYLCILLSVIMIETYTTIHSTASCDWQGEFNGPLVLTSDKYRTYCMRTHTHTHKHFQLG